MVSCSNYIPLWGERGGEPSSALSPSPRPTPARQQESRRAGPAWSPQAPWLGWGQQLGRVLTSARCSAELWAPWPPQGWGSQDLSSRVGVSSPFLSKGLGLSSDRARLALLGPARATRRGLGWCYLLLRQKEDGHFLGFSFLKCLSTEAWISSFLSSLISCQLSK